VLTKKGKYGLKAMVHLADLSLTRLQAIGYAHLGMMDDAKAAAREVMIRQPGFTISEWCQRPPFWRGRSSSATRRDYVKAGLPE
jgi:hypothetical protein